MFKHPSVLSSIVFTAEEILGAFHCVLAFMSGSNSSVIGVVSVRASSIVV